MELPHDASEEAQLPHTGKPNTGKQCYFDR
jgi:hypothetical protein